MPGSSRRGVSLPADTDLDKTAALDELWHYAKVCRVRRVMRPYLESLTQ